MKSLFTRLSTLLVASALAFAAMADATYPYTNPTYSPTAVSPAVTYSAPADYVVTTQNLSAGILQISGTCTGLTATIQGTNQLTSQTWNNLPALALSSGSIVNSLTATGAYRFDPSGFVQTRVHITALSASCTVGISGTQASNSLGVNSNDPCLSPAITKSSVAINQGSSATAALVAAATGKTTYICGFTASVAGTTPTFSLLTGTQTTTACDTGATNLTGTFAPTAGSVITLSSDGAESKTVQSGQLCMTTGATSSVQGVLSYVQQ